MSEAIRGANHDSDDDIDEEAVTEFQFKPHRSKRPANSANNSQTTHWKTCSLTRSISASKTNPLQTFASR
jgi:hypothetical protein